MSLSHVRLILLALIICACSPGCRSVQFATFSSSKTIPAETHPAPAASESRSADETPSRWPTRWGNNPDQPGTIIDLDPTEPLRPIHLSRFHQSRSSQIEYDDANQLASDIGVESGFKFKPEGPGSFLFIPNPSNKPHRDYTHDDGTLTKSNTPDLAFKFVSATPIEPDSNATLPAQDHVILQRTWFTYRDPNPKASAEQPIATIVLLPGMFGTPDPIVDILERFWHNQGYAVLRMRSQPSRFTEHELIDVNPGREPSIAIHAAMLNDERVAEGAYAVKCALEHIEALRPALIDQPTILVGLSGGAMILPTIYAYAPDEYDAAVLIAGGADFLTIAIESNYKSWIDAIVFDFNLDDNERRNSGSPNDTGSPTPEQLESLSRHYLAAARLDAYHTATEMSDIPVLMLHANNDKAVPASTGRLLYQRLGEPERWSYPLGHELIFAALPTQITRINNWLTEHVLTNATDAATD